MNFSQKVLLTLVFIILGALAYLSILPEYNWFGWLVVLIVVISGLFVPKSGSFFRFAFILISGFIAVRYILFRSFYTLDFTTTAAWIFGGILYLAEVYCMFLHLLGLSINIAPVKRKDPVYPQKEHTVDVFIPTYDEDISVAYTTALACKNFDYPSDKVNIYILNDGSRLNRLNNPETTLAAYKRHCDLKQLAEKAGIHYLTRADGNHAKAGMLNVALLGQAFSDVEKDENGHYIGKNFVKTTGEFILILDSDHIPTTDFLHETLGYFENDPKLFLAQTSHFMINREPLRHNLDMDEKLPAEGWIFYRYIQRSLDRWNATFFCGSAAVLRRSILEQNGGLEGDTITEDCETALHLHSKGFNSVYVDKPMIAGLEPESVSAMIGQRTRWCQGMLQIFFTKNPLIQKGLTLMQRLAYLNECLFWFFPIFRIVFLLAPLFFLYFQISVYNASLLQVLFFAGPYFFIALASSYYLYGRYRPFLQSEVFETIQSIALLPAIISVMLNPKKPAFKTTPKGIVTSRNTVSIYSIPFWILFVLFVGALGRAVWIYNDYPLFREAVYLTSFWNVFNLMIVICCLGSLFERKQPEHYYSFPTFNETITYRNQKLKVKRLSLSTIYVEKPTALKLKKGQKITVSGVDGKIFGTVQFVAKHALQIKISQAVSQQNIRFVYGHSSRWNNIINHYLQQKRMILLPLYLFKQGIKSMYSAFKTMMTHGFSVILVGLFLACPAQANVMQIPLTHLIEMASPEINSVYTGYRFMLHSPQRWQINNAQLTIAYNARPPIKESDLTVEATINDIPLETQITSEKIDILFPNESIPTGDSIVFIVIKANLPHENCLLTNQKIDIDPDNSILTINYTLKQLSNIDLENIYDYKQPGPANVTFVAPKWHIENLKSTLLMASNIAIHMQGRPLNITLSQTPSDKSDNILIDTNVKNITFKDGYYTVPLEIINKTPAFQQTIVQPNRVYTFEDLGAPSLTLRRANTLENIHFLIPSSLYLSPNKSVSLTLDLVYGTLVGTSGKLEIYLNDKLFSIIQLSDLNGENLNRYLTEIPMSYLKPNLNKISFRLNSNFQTNTCINPRDNSFFMTIFNSSSLSFPNTKNYTELPNIGLFFNDGFPFEGDSDLYINKLTDNIYAGVINFMAGLAGHRGIPSQKIKIYLGTPKYHGKNMIVFSINPLVPKDTVLFKQILIDGSDHVRMDISATNDTVLRQGLEDIWKHKGIETLSGNGFSLNIKTHKITPTAVGETVILTDILPFRKLTYLANNNQLLFHLLFLVCGLLIVIILFFKYRGTTDEN